MDELSRMRHEYLGGSLNETEMALNPFDEFKVWLETAIASGLSEPNAMTVASATPEGRPSARVVLLKELNEKGFVFYTNYMSRKGEELLANPFIAAVFDWHEIERQVRIEGIAEKVDEEESDAYFNVRPNDAKIGAWASPQSRMVRGREELEELEKRYANQFSGSEIPRPPHWGGFLIRPTMIEFWQGRPNRMHDRMAYYKGDKGWNMQRLAP
ncbi:pyridoxamine 5'-phosphate oxidase [Proteiniphilum sp. X52]|uniref:pyridoxamine 5'-phosphate oxidase n=1 Tax=Proteiniphilum sp. X52 TaxID=2382159 RepID=UPI000F09E69D|nr:pyridoxamine 5'-phosphate oxidase [Proteiniphilum sp. X52]RNC67032.1 pyridoxamine 5'-phosphate oxidase [Proteiniphilum sp. X52]